MQSDYTRMTIGFKRLEVKCLIGTYPSERTAPQTVIISLSATLMAAPQDLLASTIDYCTFADICRRTCQERHRDLIETLAQDILEAVASLFALERIKIAIEKPSALQDAECAFVEIEKELSVCVGR